MPSHYLQRRKFPVSSGLFRKNPVGGDNSRVICVLARISRPVPRPPAPATFRRTSRSARAASASDAPVVIRSSTSTTGPPPSSRPPPAVTSRAPARFACRCRASAPPGRPPHGAGAAPRSTRARRPPAAARPPRPARSAAPDHARAPATARRAEGTGTSSSGPPPPLPARPPAGAAPRTAPARRRSQRRREPQGAPLLVREQHRPHRVRVRRRRVHDRGSPGGPARAAPGARARPAQGRAGTARTAPYAAGRSLAQSAGSTSPVSSCHHPRMPSTVPPHAARHPCGPPPCGQPGRQQRYPAARSIARRGASAARHPLSPGRPAPTLPSTTRLPVRVRRQPDDPVVRVAPPAAAARPRRRRSPSRR